MPELILATKLYIPPPRPGIIPRPRLVERLNEGLADGNPPGLALISASAGFGKTTLVSEWLAGPGRPLVAWLSLDEGDNDPTRFLTYLVAAIQTINQNFGKGVLGVIQTSQPLTTIHEYLLTNLINEIAAIPEPFILVLDDYHVIDSQPIDQAITFLLDHLPRQMRLVISTREDPNLPLPRYRVRGQLTELRAADLRFTPEEAGAFLNQMMNLNLSVEDIIALETRTEGWIAGLQMAAVALLAMPGREGAAGFIQAFTGSHRFVLDYLVEEVLQHQPEHVRDFLLQTSLLDRLCAPLCNAVTGREDGKTMLDTLERSNLFLVPLDDTRQWYRYHHLFSDVLQAHLMEAQPDRVADLHRRASAWYERTGFRSDAIRHALAAKDFDSAASLIELAWPAAEEGSIRPAAWLSWVKTLPEALFHARPVLNVGFAFALLGVGELEAAEARLKAAAQWLEPAEPTQAQPRAPSVELIVADKEQYRTLAATIAIGRAYIAQTLGNIPDTVRYASQVLELPDTDPYRHSQAALLLGMTFWAGGDLEAAGRVFAEYTQELRKAGNIPDAISTTVVLADIRLAMGRLQEAIRSIQQLLRFVMDLGEPISPDTADLHRELCELYLEQGNLEAAGRHFQINEEIGKKTELPVWRYRRRIAQAKIHETRGDLDGALDLLDEAERLYIRSPLPDLHPISAMKARLWAAQGRLSNAMEWVNRQGLSAEDSLSFLREYEHLTLAKILIMNDQNDRQAGSLQAAMRLLERLLRTAEGGRRMGSLIEILVLQSFGHQAQGNLSLALSSFKRALCLAEPEGYARVFITGGKPAKDLLKEIAAKDGSLRGKEYILKLLSAFEIHTEAQPFDSAPEGKAKPGFHGKQAASPQPLIEPLSTRELEVLRLLRTDLNGPEIAREQMVSLTTIRTHTQNIYAKLGVNNRRAAVHRAEELELF